MLKQDVMGNKEKWFSGRLGQIRRNYFLEGKEKEEGMTLKIKRGRKKFCHHQCESGRMLVVFSLMLKGYEGKYM